MNDKDMLPPHRFLKREQRILKYGTSEMSLEIL